MWNNKTTILYIPYCYQEVQEFSILSLTWRKFCQVIQPKKENLLKESRVQRVCLKQQYNSEKMSQSQVLKGSGPAAAPESSASGFYDVKFFLKILTSVLSLFFGLVFPLLH